MIKRILLIIAILIVAVWLGLKLQGDPGYVLISMQGWRFEMPLWFALLSVLAMLIVTHVTGAVWRRIRSIKHRWHVWQLTRKQTHNEQQALRGFIALSEGNWVVAERALARAASKVMHPFIHYIGAARAALAQHALDRANDYLAKAENKTPGSSLAVKLSQAQLLLSQQQYEAALGVTKELEQQYPQQVQVLGLLKTIYVATNNWQALAALLPELRRQRIVRDPGQLQQLENQCYEHLITQAKKADLAAVHRVWFSLLTSQQRNSVLLRAYIKALLFFKADEQAEELLRRSLKREWDDDLVALYGKLNTQDPEKNYHHVEKWLRQHPQNAVLLLCAAQLAIKCDKVTQAKGYLEQCRAIKPTPHCDFYLAQCYERLGQHKEAQLYYRQAVEKLLVS